MMLEFSPGAFLAPAVDWLNINFYFVFTAIARFMETVLDAAEFLLLALPTAPTIAILMVLGFVIGGWRTAALVVACLGFCWLSGLWLSSMKTIALVTIAVNIAIAIAFPLGVLAARRPRLEALLRPLLDIMQTVPPWVYLIPAVILFSMGRVPAIIATIVYGIPPMLRLTTLAFKGVPHNLQELGQALGARPRTILFKIELPAARPTLLVGINQCILLSLAMVVLAGLVGAGGLGADVTRGLTRMEIGVGLRAGLSIVAVAVLLDRLSRGALTRVPRKHRRQTGHGG